jgi:transposase
MINLPAPEGYKPCDPKKYKGVLRRPTPSERKIIANFIAANSVYAAEAEFNISTTLGRAIRKEFNIPLLKRGRQNMYTNEDAREWLTWMKKENANEALAAVRFGVAKSTIERRVNALKANSTVL